ncbi:energy-coupling factor transporter transmembrane component T [Bradyrhizobium erythrophlei]|uniref:energy-coupling factor transporter transmembrane component T n=1 Tax=Bradyrhizobium erythrophlei TaxID=1437360 RepID=UPI0035E9DDD7
MTEMQQETRTSTAVLKVLFLLAVTMVAFAVPALSLTEPARWFVIPGLAGIQVVILLACRVGLRVVHLALRLKWLFVFLIGMYALLPPENPSANDMLMDWHVPGVGWSLSINLSGLEKAALMCLQIMTVLLASAVVRLTGTGHDLVDGLHAFRLPPLFVHALDRTLALLEGTHGRESGGGRVHDRSSRSGFFAVLRQVLRGDIGAFADVVRANIALAEKQAGADDDPRVGGQLAHDAAVITGIALCMASLKMLKVLPGLPFASGHKTFLLFPLYVLAARLTQSRWGATAAGSIMGVIGFLQGDGRFGVLEILKHVAPGLVIDIGEPLVRRWPPWALGYCMLGFFAAIARTATEFAVVLLLGARAEIYLFPAVKLVPNLVAGVLSGFVSVVLLRVVAGAGSKASSEAVEPVGDHLGQRPPGEQQLPGEEDGALAGNGSLPRHGRDAGRSLRTGHADMDRPKT